MWPVIDINFWGSFWPGLLGSLVSTIIVAGFAALLVKLYRSPRSHAKIEIAHYAPATKSKNLRFMLKNTGLLSLATHDAQCKFYVSWYCFREKGKDWYMTTVSSQPFYVYECFNAVPCHPQSEILLIDTDVKLAEPFPHDFVDDAPMYAEIYTSRGVWKPGFFTKGRKDFITDSNGTKAYRIDEICV